MQPDARRSVVLAAAAHCFAARGFHSTSVQQIAAAAGVQPGALYRYFPSKEAIIAAIIAEAHGQLLEAYSAIPASADLIDGFNTLLADEENPFGSRNEAALFAEVVAESFRNQAVEAALTTSDAELDAWVVGRVDAMKRDQPVLGELAPDAVATVLGALYDGLVLRMARSRASATDVRKVVSALLNGLRVPSEADKET
jgi:AcrR family transcriptional regulator